MGGPAHVCAEARPASLDSVNIDASHSESADFDGEGYRDARYRAPVDRDPKPAARLALPAAQLLKPGRDALFIDVLPAEGGVRDPATGTWRLAAEHQTIPGATWHPEAGRRPSDPVLWQGLVAEVVRARRKHRHLPVILFCRTDCWMGWNAARRLAAEGHDNIWWLAEGIEGWRKAGPLVVAEPVAIANENQEKDLNPWPS
ncbi:rhodanese [Croceicoccus ponticola]|uniref:Rhodanese n=2 Tax=Croceicoccus ponticola TaxID=2217664 RepID=A0A437GWH5_9SPHN|nr:rhodanese [Croceicoccus ponticola]